MALPFIPHEYIPDVFTELSRQTENQQLLELIHYIRNTCDLLPVGLCSTWRHGPTTTWRGGTTPPGSGNAAAVDQVGLRKEDEEVPAERCENKTGEDQQPVGGVCGLRDQREAATEEMFTFEWPPHRSMNYKLTMKCRL